MEFKSGAVCCSETSCPVDTESQVSSTTPAAPAKLAAMHQSKSSRTRQQGWSTHRDTENNEDAANHKTSDDLPAHDVELRTKAVPIDRAIFFMVDNSSILPWKRRLGKSTIRTTGLCDDRFYSDMRWEFWRHRGWLKSLFSLQTFAGCDFYQFTRHRKNRYYETSPGVPENDGVEYFYRRQKCSPQVSWEEFRDGYWDWSTRCGDDQPCADATAVERIPQKQTRRTPRQAKLTEQQPSDDTIIWGIVARTERAFYMALIYIMLASLTIPLSVWFVFWWLQPGEGMDEYQLANHRDNLSNACVPLALAAMLVMGTITCVFT
ncbi:hypothetical protein Micbo1qcDRAFT_17666 [Microdochium bolleyi]|uniref:Uncharacterized protein n=1 Tax=Microdochium bolleyi TaxID=196109 RepID=A0A136IUD4_9PEZI|nr:hypothetical protein Micbo1qcDRAFT_17666 [Microdochium bolleyi]